MTFLASTTFSWNGLPYRIPPSNWTHRVEDTGSAVKSRKASAGKDPAIDIYVGDEKEVVRLAKATPEYVETTLL